MVGCPVRNSESSLLSRLAEVLRAKAKKNLKKSMLIGGLVAITILLSLLTPIYTRNVSYLAERSPSLDIIFQRIREGDAAFQRREYLEAEALYNSARGYIVALRDSGYRASTDVPTFNYLEASTEARIRLARVGTARAENGH